MSRMPLSSLQTLLGRKSFYLLLLAVSVGLCAAAFPPTKKVSGQQPQSCPTCSQPIERTIYAPTIGLPEATGSEIVLNCRSARVMNVTPTFYTIEGTPIVGAAIQMQPSEMRFVAIETLIPEEHRGQHLWGGMSLSYTGKTLEMWAQITLHGLGGTGSADVTFSVLDNRGSDTQESLWWMPNGNSTAIIALGNSSNTPIRTRLQYSDNETEEVEIAPFATRYIRRQRGNSVKLTTAGAAGSLKATGFVTNSSQRFTSGIRFYDTQGIVQPNLFATNFKLKNHSPHLLLKNTATTSIAVQPRFRPMNGTGGTVELPQLILSPNQVVELDLRPLTTAARTRNDLNAVSAQISNSGSPGSLIGALYSTDQTTSVNQDIPLRDSGRLRNSTGAYPWRLDDDYSSVVSITNVGSQTAQFSTKIYYKGGTYTPKLSELAVGETASFDLRRLRDERVPDQNGSVIPATVTVGQFSWSALRASDEIRMNGRSEVVSRSRRVSSSYSCPVCCPNSGPFYGVNGGITPYVDGFSLNGVYEEWADCYGRTVIYDGASIPNLSVTDPNIASATMMSYGTMQTNGLAVGGTEWFSEHLYWRYFDDGMDCYTDVYNTYSSGPIAVVPIHRGQIQAQGSNPPVEKSRSWTQSHVPTKSEGLAKINAVWDELTRTERRERGQAYIDAYRYIENSPREGRPFNGNGGKSFYDPQRSDPTARIDVVVIVGLAFKDDDFSF